MMFTFGSNHLAQSTLSQSLMQKQFGIFLGIIITQIEDAPIAVPSLTFTNCKYPQHEFIAQIKEHFEQSIYKIAFKLLGSLNILGNPIKIAQNIQDGFKSFVTKPVQGLQTNLLDGSQGMLEGTGKLLKSTVTATSHSIDKITNLLSTGLTYLSFDTNYINERYQIQIQKPTQIGEGVEQGIISLYIGLKYGVLGLFTFPYEETKKNGILGFFQGSCKGISGLILKPLSGILDATSKTAEGIKNAACCFDEAPNEKRIRKPRPFYDSFR